MPFLRIATDNRRLMPLSLHLQIYFVGEKREAFVILVTGILAVALSGFLLATKDSYRGMAVPLLLIGLLEVGVGGAVFGRTNAQVATLEADLARAPQATTRRELERMRIVMRTFAIVKIVELVIFALGVALTYTMRRNEFAFAAGVGCVAQASVILLFDLFAERRAEPYLEALRQAVG